MMLIAWVGLTAIGVVAFIRSMRFRRGDDRSYMGLYRNAHLPAAYRHLPLAAPFASGYLLALLLAAGLRGLLPRDAGDPRLDLLLAGLMATTVLGVFVTAIVRMSFPPAWLSPMWLADDDGQVGYVRPKLGLTDYAWLAVAAFVLFGMIVTVAYAAFVLLA